MRHAKPTLTIAALLLAATPGLAEGLPSLEATLAHHSTLHDVAFHDARLGWAVGDRGLVLRTEDGGDHWTRIETPTGASLHSVCFIDANRGWVAGGLTRPYTHETEAVLLHTDNGGREWTLVSHTPLPKLRLVKFFDKKRGVAAGAGSAFTPSGVFTTDDGGREWRPLSTGAPRQWIGGDFLLDPLGELAGVVTGVRGEAARVSDRRVSAASGFGDLRSFRAAKLLDESNGWMVGDGGLVRSTEDGGKTWLPAISEPPAELAEWFDWRTIAARDKRIWIAGSPGAQLLLSNDGGQSWSTSPTGVCTPLNDVEFVDDRLGWAVGEFGVVLATRDGGATWTTQRGVNHRAAVLVVAGAPTQLPAEPLMMNATAEGYRAAILTPMLPESHTTASTTHRRFNESSVLLGADGAGSGWRVPLESADHAMHAPELLATLDTRTDGQTKRFLSQRLLRALLTYRPDVVVLPQSQAHPGLSELLSAAATEAAKLALEDPPEAIGLTPWNVERLIAIGRDNDTQDRDTPGQRISVAEFSRLLGATPSQACRGAWGLLADAYYAPPAAYRWQVIAGSNPGTLRHGDLLTGINHARGGPARRPAALTPVDRLRQLRLLAEKRRNMHQLLEKAQGDPAWAGQVVDLTGGLDAESGAELLHQLAEGYRAVGRNQLAAETLYLLAQRYPGAPLADNALVWLVRYYASSERSHADARSAAVALREKPTLANVPSGVRQLSLLEEQRPLTPDERAQRASQLVDYLKTARPTLYANPSLRFAEAAAQRRRGFGADAERIALLLSKQSISDDWRRAASAERWLAEPEGLPPEKPMVTCRYTPRRPKLDGRLNEQLWERAEKIHLRHNGSGDPSCTVRTACDDEFLYLALEASSDQSTTKPLAHATAT